MRGNQVIRQWRLLRHIEASSNGLTINELSELEGISLRTAYRDLEVLQEAGFPLHYKRVERANRWRFVDTYHFQLPLPFTLTELMSLYVYKDLIRMFRGTAFYDALESLFRKVRSTLPPQTLAYLERVQSTFSVGLKPYKPYGRFREIVNQVNQAATDRRRIEIAYQSLNSEVEHLRKIDPYHIRFFDGTIYLIAFCHLRNEIRMFVPDRIRMLRVTEESFEYPEDFDVNEYMTHSFKVMHDELHLVRIAISPAWARWAGEKTWHDSQSQKKHQDGSLEMTFRVAGLEEIKQWVLSLGPEARVIEPETLKDMVMQSMNEALAQYGKPETIPAAASPRPVKREKR